MGRSPFLKPVLARPKSEGSHLRLLTNFNQGGWCRWAMHDAAPDSDIRVTLDGRTQYVPDKRFRDANTLFSAQPGWEQILSSLQPDAALIPKNQALAAALANSTHWRLLLQDKDYVVFVPLGQDL